MRNFILNSERLIERLNTLGEIGIDAEGRRTRLALSDEDKLGRDQLVRWIHQDNLELGIDEIGNIFGIWRDGATNPGADPILIGSHIDTVIDAGKYDGCFGVISGLEIVTSLKEQGFTPNRPIAFVAFTNEEGTRFHPDMVGSLAFAGGITRDEAFAGIGIDGAQFGAELQRIGYLGTEKIGFIKPHAYLEIHIEQGIVLEQEQLQIGAVENLQGISWQRITIEGTANHAGTTPIGLRHDAGYAAAKVVTFLRDMARNSDGPTVATVGTMKFEPNAVNVIPSRAVFTVDLRDPNAERLAAHDAAIASYCVEIAQEEGVVITSERMVQFPPVQFNAELVDKISAAAEKRGVQYKRMTSGAGHDAQMVSRIAPAAMIFVPSVAGISHNPKEFTKDEDLIRGAEILLDVVADLSLS